jgi:PIN domain nuclease of toxin-antitoxin system
VILLDTHVAIWVITNDDAIGKHSRSLVEQAAADDELAISSVSFWEMAMLVAKRRLRFNTPAADQRAKVLAANVREIPLTGDLAILAVQLEHLHGDPADRFIVATAIAHHATLLTADDSLLRWRHTLRRQNAAQ